MLKGLIWSVPGKGEDRCNANVLFGVIMEKTIAVEFRNRTKEQKLSLLASKNSVGVLVQVMWVNS